MTDFSLDIGDGKMARLRPGLVNSTLNLDPRRQLRVLWVRRNILFLCLASVLALTWTAVSLATPLYSAQAGVMIDNRKMRIIDFRDMMTQMQPGLIQVTSEVEVIHSRALAQRVATKLGLYDDPEFNASLRPKPRFNLGAALQPVMRIIGGAEPPALTDEEKTARTRAQVVSQLLARLDVKPIPQSMVIQLTYRSPDPKKAAQIANAFADGFVMDQIESRFEVTKQISDWLNGRLEGLRQQVSASERAVETYRSTNGLFESKGLLGAQQKLTELNTLLIAAQANRAAVEAKVAHLETLRVAGGDEFLDSPLIQRLKEQEEQLSREIADISTRYGEKHPNMIKALAGQKELHDKIKMEIGRLSQSERGELSIARSRETALRDQIKSLEDTVLTQNQLGIKLRDLEREAQSNRALYETFLNRSKETTQEADIKQADARVISRAERPETPSSPNRPMFLAAATIAGLLLGAIMVFLREHLDRSLRSPEQLEAITGVPSIGMIQTLRPTGKDKGANINSYVVDHPHSAIAESFRSLWVSLKHANRDNPPHLVVVTSSLPGEGKSFTSLSLARTVAGLGARVALVDCDLRRPTITKIVGVQPAHFFDEALSGHVSLAEATYRDPLTSLDILASRVLERPPLELLNSQRMTDLLDELRNSYDLVIIDTPPTMAVSDVQIIAQKADKVLFVVRWEKTPKEVVLTTLRMLRDVKINVAGTLLTQVNLNRHARYGYGDVGYYYGKYKGYYSD
ncbi:MAG TPA: polysaccharide biosynthesis tyrosine autokinase [Telmatospirillum sp.]|nr:polysaccharide biosynthesis tyrosine autokinase [Telmatospirillum sp.]